MSSPSLATRLEDSFRQVLVNQNPKMPKDILNHQVARFAYRTVQELRGFVSELSAEASASNDSNRSSALLDLFELLGTTS